MSRPQRWFGEGQGMDSTSPLPAYPDYEEMNGFFRIFRIFNVGYLCVLTFQRTAKGAGRAAAGSPVSEGHLQSSA